MHRITRSSAERERLEQAARSTRDKQVWLRMRALLLWDEGQSATQVSRTLDVGRQSLYEWRERYLERRDPADLLDRPKSGRKPSLSPAKRERLAEILEQEPKEYDHQSHGWTVPLLVQHLQSHEDVSLSGTTLRRTLRSMGYCWKRPRYVLARKDPERAKKKAALLERIRALPKHTVVLFCDESLLWEFPPLRAAWAKKGQQARVAVTGNSARRTIFGVLNPRTGKRLLLTRIRNRAEDFQAFLRCTRAQYRRWDILLILDQASSHTARKTKALAEKLRIAFAFLPTACPELNPTELLWRRAKDHVSANRIYPKVQEQAEAFVNHLLSMSNRQTLRTTGCLSPTFWLPA